MSDLDQETVADIMAEIRAYGAQPPPRCMWLEIADRVETAARRERDHAIEHATRHAEAVARDNCRDCVHNPRGKNFEGGNGGNAAAMRDIVTALAAVILPPRGKADEDGWLAWVRAMQAKARAALADATTEKSSAVGNAAAMREALENAYSLLCEGIATEVDDELEHPFHLELAREKIQDALAAPARNCDVGTPDEQTRRMFEQYCSEQISCYELPSGEHCPLHCTGVDCRLAWAQMPYVAQEGVRE